MILIFDLDDTLYDERSFVLGGLRAVAQYGETEFGWDADRSLAFMTERLDRQGRGRIFDDWLAARGKYTRGRVRDCVRIYRYHRPALSLFPAARTVLDRYRPVHPLYLVTDGHKVVQKNKVDALDLWGEFRRVMITHRFGRRNAKPSIHCFQRIREIEACGWPDLIYVGDNPQKDFVNLNKKGAKTVRVLTGVHRGHQAGPGYDAQHTIADLNVLPELLDRIGGRQ